MLDWLIQRFIPNMQATDDPEVRESYGVFASAVNIICNIALALAKILTAAFTSSIAIAADALNNLSDAISGIISYLGFHFAARPADNEHPFGHGRAEYLSGLSVSVIVCAIGLNLMWESLQRIANPVDANTTPWTYFILLLALALKLWLSCFNANIGERISSLTLKASSVDARADVLATAGVLVSALVSQATSLNLDGPMGLIIGAFVFWSGTNLVQEAISPLLGQSPSEELVDHIRSTILSFPEVLGTHDLMVHDYGAGRQFASAHVEMAAEKDALSSHEIIDTIERYFREEEGLQITLHLDPIVTNDPEVIALRSWLEREVKNIDPRLAIHDLRMVPGDTHVNVIFDLVRPQLFAMSDAELREKVEELVRARKANALCKITIEPSYTGSTAL